MAIVIPDINQDPAKVGAWLAAKARELGEPGPAITTETMVYGRPAHAYSFIVTDAVADSWSDSHLPAPKPDTKVEVVAKVIDDLVTELDELAEAAPLLEPPRATPDKTWIETQTVTAAPKKRRARKKTS